MFYLRVIQNALFENFSKDMAKLVIILCLKSLGMDKLK